MARLRDRVFPMMLCSPAHDQEITGAELNPVTGPTALWAQEELSGTSQAHDGHQWIELRPSNSVGVPSNAVLTCFVVVAEEARERTVASCGQFLSDLRDR